jgi:hypothetical protein
MNFPLWLKKAIKKAEFPGPDRLERKDKFLWN